MTCLRCDGLMVSIEMEDSRTSSLRSKGWQCLLCGDITDAVIVSHRKGQPQPRRYEPRLQGYVTRSL